MSARTLLRIDAAFEAALAVVLIAGAGTGLLDGDDAPFPFGRWGLLALGVALALAAIVLDAAARTETPGRLLLPLALVNDASGVAGVLWLALGDGFSAAGAAITVVAVAGLFALSTAQAVTAVRSRSSA